MTLATLSATRSRVSGLLLGLMLFLCLASAACSDPIAPSGRDHYIAIAVERLLDKRHLSGREMDDEVSRRALKIYIENLDPAKSYFYQSDIDRYMKSQNDLDDMIRKGDLTLGYTIFADYLQRVDERIALVDELLAMEHDFTLDEEILVDKDLLTYPKNEAEARERWRKRIKHELLAMKADIKDEEAEELKDEDPATQLLPPEVEDEKDADEDPVARLSKRLHSFAKRRHQTDNDELLEMYLSAMTMAYDPHTSYMSKSTLENFQIQMRLELEGIGASLQSEDGYTVVHKIIPGGAADKDGRLKPEDSIVGVAQADGPIEDVVEMKLGDVVKRIRGKEGTIVRLEVRPKGGGERQIIDITRAKIELKDSEAKSKVFEAGIKPNGRPYKLGVIDLPSFYMDMEGASLGLPNYKSTTNDVLRIIEDFNREGIDAVVLDLRLNGGGSLTEAINLTGLFIEEGPVVQVKDPAGQVRAYRDPNGGIAWSGPLVVLTSQFSASASEILAGAIQDYGRGLIIGDHATHGKGTVQSLIDIGEELFRGLSSQKLGALKITIQQFYRPSGDSTQNRGVLADIELPSLSTHYDIGEADLDYPVEFDHVNPVSHEAFNYVTEGITGELNRRSAERQFESDDFRKVRERIDFYLERKDRDTRTLNEEKYAAELAKLDADKEEEDAFKEIMDGDSEIKRTFYLDEVFAIAVDYIGLLAPATHDAARMVPAR